MAAHTRLRESLAAAFAETRRRTLAIAAAIPEEAHRRRVHPFYSPFGWHLGHVGMTEAYWILRCARGDPPFRPDLEFIFANCVENPKENRVHLPSGAETLAYLDGVRARALDFLTVADFDAPDPLLSGAYCFRYVLAHEWQHQETMIELLHLIEDVRPTPPLAPRGGSTARAATPGREVIVPPGEFVMGNDDPHAYDNERPAHRVFVPGFALDETPVTVAQYCEFREDGGYRRRELWERAGWAWVETHAAAAPAHGMRSPLGGREPDPDEPVCGVNGYEASAYARWKGKRLPTEVEWEKAAAWSPETGESRRYPWGEAPPTPERADHDAAGWWPAPVGSFPEGRSAVGALDLAGGVWEWTSTVFGPYDGFVAFPYEGYSRAHFDGSCRVLKGGSWATRGPLLRCAFRNFYPPEYRQGFLGFRCARSL
jgi:iron(II)-dependent oxidoreductase